MAIAVGIAGASGYTGVELIRILSNHPEVRLHALAAGRSAGSPMAASWPGLTGLGLPALQALDVDFAAECDVLFLALPHGVSAGFVAELAAAGQLDRGLKIIDLGADFRLRDPAAYKRAYKLEHPCPELLAEAVYGLPEANREAVRGARIVANPGCYPTATAIAAMPLVESFGASYLVADCISGVSGAGRAPTARNLYCETEERLVAYGVAGAHRHGVEIEQTLGVSVTFTPHLAPLIRGMTATVHARLDAQGGAVDLARLRAAYVSRYADHPLVTVLEEPPSSGEVRGTARALVSVHWDAERSVATATSAIDNLGKGAAGQAVHNLNLLFGLPETVGLPLFPFLP